MRRAIREVIFNADQFSPQLDMPAAHILFVNTASHCNTCLTLAYLEAPANISKKNTWYLNTFWRVEQKEPWNQICRSLTLPRTYPLRQSRESNSGHSAKPRVQQKRREMIFLLPQKNYCPWWLELLVIQPSWIFDSNCKTGTGMWSHGHHRTI